MISNKRVKLVAIIIEKIRIILESIYEILFIGIYIDIDSDFNWSKKLFFRIIQFRTPRIE